MSFFPDLTNLNNKITDFSQKQTHSQQEIIALLKQISLELAQIKTYLQQNQIWKTNT